MAWDAHSMTSPFPEAPMLRFRLAALALALPAPLLHAPPALAQPAEMHPAQLMTHAGELFGQGQRDDATFWFYLGQLRYRAYLSANPGLDPSGEPAVFASLLDGLGPQINGWAFGDIPQLAATIDRVLAYDAQNHDPTLPAPVVAEIRTGLEEMRDTILAQEAEIRATRELNGLENR